MDINAITTGLSRKKRREIKSLSVGQKRMLMADLRLDLAKLTIKRNDSILDANLVKWNSYISGKRTEGISKELQKMIEFVDKCHEEYRLADIEDIQNGNANG